MKYSHIPPPLPQNNSLSASDKCFKYIRRILKYDQMDFQFAFWQMLYLFIAPQKLNKLFRARKLSKSQLARDDPAFLILFAACLCITSIGFAIVLQLTFLQFCVFLLFVIFVDFIAVGILIASVLWFLANKCLNTELQDIEWGFCFDAHLNAFFPPLILLHFLELFFYNGLINHELTISIFLGNTLWLCAVLYYIYITFLAYNSLQTLRKVHIFLSPIPWVIILYIISLVTGVNLSQLVMNFYKNRVV